MEWDTEWGDGGGFSLLEKGDYDFEVTAAEAGTSNAGNEMIALTLKVFDGNGGSRELRDWLVATEGAGWRIKDFCAAVRLDFDAGKMDPSDCLHKTGRAKIKIEKDEYDGNTRERNRVDRYLEAGETAVAELSKPAATQPGDDLPF